MSVATSASLSTVTGNDILKRKTDLNLSDLELALELSMRGVSQELVYYCTGVPLNDLTGTYIDDGLYHAALRRCNTSDERDRVRFARAKILVSVGYSAKEIRKACSVAVAGDTVLWEFYNWVQRYKCSESSPNNVDLLRWRMYLHEDEPDCIYYWEPGLPQRIV